MNGQIVNQDDRVMRLSRRIFLYAIFNLFLVAIVGVILRSIPVTGIGVNYYKNILHAHSHFAFGGWIMPALFSLLLTYYPDLTHLVAYKHWRNIGGLLLLSAYGMLISFPFQGYAPVSIGFSTLAILASFYLALVTWKVRNQVQRTVAFRFLLAGLFYLVLSSIGPFGTVPLIIAGKVGTPLYFNAIYFFLHFQYNGWFSFLLLGILYKIASDEMIKYGNGIFWLMHVACIPTYFLSVLWNHPPSFFYIAGGGAALLQVVAMCLLLPGIGKFIKIRKESAVILRVALAAFILKLLLQAASSIPAIANLAFAHRNFIIVYLHLVLLGFVTFFILGTISPILGISRLTKIGMVALVITWLISESILLLQALGSWLGFVFSHYESWILGASTLFPPVIFLVWIGFLRDKLQLRPCEDGNSNLL